MLSFPQELKKYVKSSRRKIIDLTCFLVKQDTANPPGHEERVVKIVKDFFKRERIKFKIVKDDAGKPNIIGYLGKGRPRFLVGFHSDVAPVGQGWKTAPFQPVIKKGKIFGRGALDNKGPLASFLVLMKFLKNQEQTFKGQLIVPVVANEEIGKNSLVYLVKQKIIKPDLAIVPDIGRHLKEMSIGEKGKLVLRVTSSGKSAHAFQPWLGHNAILPLAKFLLILQQKGLKYKPDKSFIDGPTINIGTIKGGEASNNVPDWAEAELDIRYLPTQTAQDILKQFQKIQVGFKKAYPYCHLKFDILRDAKPFVLSKNLPLIKIIQAESEKVLSRPTKPVAQGGGTIARTLVHSGIPAIGLAPGDEDIFHVPNEYVEIQELLDFAELIGLIIYRIIGKNKL